jgi:hypothetical protein
MRTVEDKLSNVLLIHYYTNDFRRQYQNVNGDGHKIQSSPKIPGY